MDLTITRLQIEQLLHLTNLCERTRRRKLAALMARHKFPKPLPGFFDVWSRVSVEAWVNGQGAGVTPLAPAPVSSPEGLSALRERLEQAIHQRQQAVCP